ncbi:polygalacturonase inhibitor-like [Alnus glutinosa]|uniref:polygalacturonase inhibitor-like n=1 Tax=Alnus glutinosa TaxID=3517 RepID=UPI002D78CE73|nr:polygalacturonase inhibitor-like [Alnus glutinosa]
MAIPLLSLFCLFTLLFSSAHSELCNPKDKKVLLQIKAALNNPYLLASWNPATDCCDWYCVTCNSTSHRINSLTIFAGEISGQIPAEVGDLPYLENLEFHKLSNLTGPIQPAIAKLKNLNFLTLSWTNLSGPVPDFLSKLKNLNSLDLSFNDLSGSIPSSLSLLPNLNGLRLDRNKLTGPIPESFGNFTKVPDLYLSHNQLTGKIPASFAKMDFSVIDLSRNKLEGDASVVFGSNKTTQIVDLSRNLLQFDLSKVQFPKSLTSLDLNHNNITGSIPVAMTALNLQFLNVSYNRLCGKIPVGGKLQSFDYSSYFHNRCLCGSPLPNCK